MKSNILKIVFLSIMASGIFSSCVNDKEYEVLKAEIVTYDLVANKTVAQIIAAPTGLLTPYAADDIIEAYVSSSDESGTFYNTICFQTIPVGNTPPSAFSVTVEVKGFVQGFTPGRKVFIKMKGLYSQIVDGSLKIGSLYQGSIGRIASYDWNKYLFPSAVMVSEQQLVRTVSLLDAATNANLNSLIDIDNVQFSDNSLSRTLYDIDSGGLATNHNIVDVSGGRNRYLRISSFSLLKGVPVPSGRGKIRGVMTKFGSDYQFIVRYESDFRLTNPRVYTFNSTLNENFSSYPASGSFSLLTSTYSFANYINLTTEGTKNWFVKSGGVLEMSSFGGNVENNKCYFMVPVDMTAASNFAFKVSVAFFSNKLGLKVYRTNDYVPGTKINKATLFDISSSFPIPSANVTNLAVNYPIPATVTGNGFFIFEYTGTSLTNGGPVVTTTIQLDDIVVN